MQFHFAAKLEADHRLQIKAFSAGTLVITNISLDKRSQTARLFYFQHHEYDKDEQFQIVALSKRQLQSYHTEFKIIFPQYQMEMISASQGTSHILGYYLLKYPSDNESTNINDVLRINKIKKGNSDWDYQSDNDEQAKYKTAQKIQRLQKVQKRQTQQKEVVVNKEVSVRRSTRQKMMKQQSPKVQSKQSSKKLKKSSGIMNMLELLQAGGDEQDDQSDYQQQNDSQSSQSQEEQDIDDPQTKSKKQAKYSKMQRKGCAQTKEVNEDEGQGEEELKKRQIKDDKQSNQVPFQYRIPTKLPQFVLKK